MRDVERRALAAGVLSPWLCRTIFDWLDDLRHKHHISHDFLCFYALRETDNWTTSAMSVPGYIVYGRDHGRIAIFVPTGG